MAYVLKNRLANRSNYGSKRALSNIKFIVVHYTANDGDSDEGNGNHFANHIIKTSAHYFVDGDSITQSVPDNYIAYSVGGSKYTDCKKTGGGKFYGRCTNANSISIELCDEVKNGKSDFSAATIDNAVEYIKVLMKKYDIPDVNVLRHFDVTGKICPKPFINEDKWTSFVTKLKGVEIDMDELKELKDKVEELKAKIEELSTPEMVYNYMDNNMPEWARKSVQKAVNKGIVLGTGKGLGLTMTDLKCIVREDRCGLYD